MSMCVCREKSRSDKRNNGSQVEPLLVTGVAGGSQCKQKLLWTHYHYENFTLNLYLKFQWNIKSSQDVINKLPLKYDILKYNVLSCF